MVLGTEYQRVIQRSWYLGESRVVKDECVIPPPPKKGGSNQGGQIHSLCKRVRLYLIGSGEHKGFEGWSELSFRRVFVNMG